MATMLIVEDDPIVAQDLQRQFTHLGHTVLACVSSAQEAIAHVQLHRPALVLMDLRLSGEKDGLAAGHAIQAIDDVRVIYFAGERSAQLAEHTAPPVLWYYDGEAMNLEALHRILSRTMESGQRPLRPPLPLGRDQSAAIWCVPRVLWEGLEQVPRQARKAYQQVVQLRGWAKRASRATGELGDAAVRRPPEAEQQTSRMAMNASVKYAQHAGKSGRRDMLDDIVPPGGGGELGALMRALDWAKTPVGPISQWPQALRTAVSICLNSRFPMVLWWGQPAYTMFYNDAYRPVLGRTKHPGWLGRSGRECWHEIWDLVGPMIDSVFATGEATWSEDLLLIMDRNLPREEVYFTFSYSPIYVESGRVGGVFTACTETTERVVGERRLRTLSDLAARTSEARTAEEACQLAWQRLAIRDSEVAFALVYLLSADGTQAHLVVDPTGLDPRASPKVIALSDAADEAEDWPLAEVAASGNAVLVTDLVGRFGPLLGGMWPEPATTALVLPLAPPGYGQLAGFLVAGANPRRVLDVPYRTFFELVASQIATAIAHARAYEAERRRAETLAELDRAKTTFFSNVSHEFRTPLTLLLGPLDDLLTGPARSLAPADRAALQVVQRNGLRLLRLVNTLLDFSRIEAGRVDAVYEPMDLATLTAELEVCFAPPSSMAACVW
jgi:GAF domain-containing protein/CheY-like chemotaxis protein